MRAMPRRWSSISTSIATGGAHHTALVPDGRRRRPHGRSSRRATTMSGSRSTIWRRTATRSTPRPRLQSAADRRLLLRGVHQGPRQRPAPRARQGAARDRQRDRGDRHRPAGDPRRASGPWCASTPAPATGRNSLLEQDATRAEVDAAIEVFPTELRLTRDGERYAFLLSTDIDGSLYVPLVGGTDPFMIKRAYHSLIQSAFAGGRDPRG